MVDIDLSKFFDRINHDRLIYRLKNHVPDKRILRLIGMILRSGIMSQGVITISTEGSVQGSPKNTGNHPNFQLFVAYLFCDGRSIQKNRNQLLNQSSIRTMPLLRNKSLSMKGISLVDHKRRLQSRTYGVLRWREL